jgi:hypothetical protein
MYKVIDEGGNLFLVKYEEKEEDGLWVPEILVESKSQEIIAEELMRLELLEIESN